MNVSAKRRPGGLIPAHAGKTDSGKRSWIISRAHPRSRGENHPLLQEQDGMGGSSPLTRGKPRRASPTGSCTGLIPAHAGKTLAAGAGKAMGDGLIPAHAGKTMAIAQMEP